MNRQQGFTLMELMVVIAIMAILSATALPGYQRYLERAALTDMLRIASPYRLAVELCELHLGALTDCHGGTQGIPESVESRYVSGVNVRQGTIRLTGRHTLAGLTLVMTPTRSNNALNWSHRCDSAADDRRVEACAALFPQALDDQEQ